MGTTQIRRLCKNESRWTDKTAPKHKHEFSVHAIARLKRIGGGTDYYDVMKCAHCNSFKSIPKEGSCNGFISGGGFRSDLPQIRLVTTHKYFIGFKGAELDK